VREGGSASHRQWALNGVDFGINRINGIERSPAQPPMRTDHAHQWRCQAPGWSDWGRPAIGLISLGQTGFGERGIAKTCQPQGRADQVIGDQG